MGDKFAPLGDDEIRNTSRGDEWTPVVPVPDGAPKALAAIDASAKFKGFVRTGLWQYTDAQGRLLAFTARFDHPPNGELREKEFRQFTFCGNASRRREWRCKSLPQPRPLFGLARLAENPGAPVLIVEGEKTAVAAATCFHGHVVVTSSHGAKSAKTADWSPLAGREVTIWPDRDTPGNGYAADVAAIVSKSGARSVRIVTVPPDFPDGWDLADKAPEGADLRALLDAAAPWRNGPDARAPKKPKFQLTPFNDIKFETDDEWLGKKLLPRKGVAAIYGASGSVKTFILLDLLLHVALGWPWAGRRVVQTPTIYIAAEGAAGLHKRKIGWELAHDGLPDNVPFHLIEVAPNLGAGASDLKELIASIEAASIKPGAIAIDTVAQSMGVGDENNTGMVQFAANITALANHFGCLVAAVHHVGLGDEKRLRGHSSFLGALDVSILSERKEGTLSATLTVMKLKDEESAQKFTIHLARVVIGKDSDGEDVSTLIVESVESSATEGAKAPQAKAIPRAQRLLIAMVEQAIGEDETAKMIRPFADGPLVKAVSDETVRRRYYARIAEKTAPGEDHQKLADRQRQAFYRAVNDALKALILMACEREGARFLWLP